MTVTVIAPLQEVIQRLLETDSIRNITETSPKDKLERVGTKIRPDALRQGDVPPFIAIEVPEDNTLPDLSGYSGQGIANISVICVAAYRETSITIANAVNAILNNYRGSVSGTNTRIDHCFLTSPARGYEPPQDDGDESHGFYIAMQYSVMWTAS